MRKLLLSVFVGITLVAQAHEGHFKCIAVNGDTLILENNLDSAYQHFTRTSQSTLFEGYTIQVFSGNRKGANSVRANIISLGFEEAARMVYREPNFKIHIGSYPDMSSAEKALKEWKKTYPDAFVIKTAVPWYPIDFKDENVPLDRSDNAE